MDEILVAEVGSWDEKERTRMEQAMRDMESEYKISMDPKWFELKGKTLRSVYLGCVGTTLVFGDKGVPKDLVRYFNEVYFDLSDDFLCRHRRHQR